MIIQTRSGTENDAQVFFFDEVSKTIKSRKYNRSVEISQSGHGFHLQVWTTNSAWYQTFKYDGQNIKNPQNGKVFDVFTEKDAENQRVIVWKEHDKLNQHWTIEYLDG